jgi:uncharacterized Zn-binding protein involved in type VI secretion
MTKPAAKEADKIIATDTHSLNGTPTLLPFNGVIDGNLSDNVLIEHRPAAMVDSTATNTPAHVPPPGKTFDTPPKNRAVIVQGSVAVLINNRAVARDGDAAITCNDPADLPVGSVAASSTIRIGR